MMLLLSFLLLVDVFSPLPDHPARDYYENTLLILPI
jgi:hypothetical protein